MSATVRLRAYRRRQFRIFALTLLAVAVTGMLVAWFPDRVAFQQMFQADAPGETEAARVEPEGERELALPRQAVPDLIPAEEDRAGHARTAREREVATRFQQAVSMLHMRQYDYAMAALHRVLELAPEMPEAHVNMGFALLGLEQYGPAYDFFQGAAALRPDQSNAYFGMAVALEGLGDLRGALGAMRTFIHLSPADNPYLERARAALWEWESELTRVAQAQTDNGTASVVPGEATASQGTEQEQDGAEAPRRESPAD